jgi:hypothetical protein
VFVFLLCLQTAVQHQANLQAFSINSETVTSVYRKPYPPSSGRLLLEQYDAVEPK